MTTLGDVAASVKSANAGATQLTMEIGFADAETFDRVCAAVLPTLPETVGLRYGLPADAVRVWAYRPALTLKITVPRGSFADQLAETDFDGVQQHVPLLDVRVPEVGG
jgi:uncharacterized protein DUF4387